MKNIIDRLKTFDARIFSWKPGHDGHVEGTAECSDLGLCPFRTLYADAADKGFAVKGFLTTRVFSITGHEVDREGELLSMTLTCIDNPLWTIRLFND